MGIYSEFSCEDLHLSVANILDDEKGGQPLSSIQELLLDFWELQVVVVQRKVQDI